MMNLNLSFALLQTVAAANLDGFTVDKNTFEPITNGFAVAVAETQNSFDLDGAKNVIKYAYIHPEVCALGGWYNSENGKFYYDAVIIVHDLETAKRLGRENEQIAIFNLSTLEEIRL